MLSAAVTNREKELRHELSDDEVRDVAAKERKKRAESIAAFEGAGRHELADKERAEQETIESYAPEQLSEEQVDDLIDQAFAETGATSEKELGAVMSLVMGRAKGRVDGKLVQEKVRARMRELASSPPPPPPPPLPPPPPFPPFGSAPTKIVTVVPWITIFWLGGSCAIT